MLARQALYCLSHTSSPYYSGYFEDKFSLFAQASLHCGPIYSSHNSWGDRHASPCSAFAIEMGRGWVLQTFCLWLPWNHDPPDLNLLHSLRWQVFVTRYWLRWGLMNYLTGLGLNSDPPDFSLWAIDTQLSYLVFLLLLLFFKVTFCQFLFSSC
jgi:hypothetical protein